MKNSIREEIVKHPAKKLFDIVIDIESYPEYIPWCTRMVVNERKGNEIYADMYVQYKFILAQKFGSHVKYNANILDEVKFLKNIVSKLKRVWTSLKSKIKSLFSKKLRKLGPGEETIVTIPGLKNENKIEYMNLKNLLNEGALQAIKGNYNEALTCQYLYKNDGKKGVEITTKYKPIKSEVDNIVKKWDKDLKNAVDNYSAAKKIIDTGSKDMARYLIGSVINISNLLKTQ